MRSVRLGHWTLEGASQLEEDVHGAILIWLYCSVGSDPGGAAAMEGEVETSKSSFMDHVGCPVNGRGCLWG